MNANGGQINLDLSKSTPVKCEVCGNYTFTEVALMFHLSALVSPTGQETNAPIPTYACNSCGNINDAFLPRFMRKPVTPESSLVTDNAAPMPKPVNIKLER